MLIQLLDYLQSGETYSVQELAELLHKDVDSVQIELEYLENQGYIQKVTFRANCDQNCNGCHGCDQPASDIKMWKVVKRMKSQSKTPQDRTCEPRGMLSKMKGGAWKEIRIR